jgi:hypothetical protein
VTITIGALSFDNVEYDADADVLYLSVGEAGTPAESFGTPEEPQRPLRRDGYVHRHHDREREVAA